MISISETLPKYRNCIVCRGYNDVRDITLLYASRNASQGVAIALCKHCRKELANLLVEYERRSDESNT